MGKASEMGAAGRKVYFFKQQGSTGEILGRRGDESGLEECTRKENPGDRASPLFK